VKPKIPESKKKEEPTLFCTECGASLDDFSLSGAADDLEAVKANQLRCKHLGKFQGEMCAKLFIARTDLPDPPDDRTDPEE
jgi:hypothetical protein